MLAIGLNRDHVVQRVLGDQRNRYRILDGGYRIERGIDHRDAACHRRIQLQHVHMIELVRSREDAVASADRRAVIKAIGKTEARRDVPVLVFP